MKINDNQFFEYITMKKEECTTEEKTLRADNRQDEANLCKIRFNVYDIFAVLLKGARTMMEKKEFAARQEREQAVYEEFQARCKRIPASWHENLAKAKQFGATDKAVIEEIKLGVVEEILQYFEQCCSR